MLIARGAFMQAVVAMVLLLLACVGCGSNMQVDNDGGLKGDSSSPPISDAGDAGVSKDAASDCVPLPAPGSACTPGQVSCDHVDPCCAQVIVCDAASSTWKPSGLACLQCEGFACGSTTCTGGSLCLGFETGHDAGPTEYKCVSIPDACSHDWTCGCVKKALGCSQTSVSCRNEGTHLTVTCGGV